jgi:hypothetical protein
MEGAGIETALQRIEAALARVEMAAVERTAAVPDGAASDLETRHQGLRAAVAKSLRDLDELLAGGPA